MSFYSDMQGVSVELITEFGRDTTINTVDGKRIRTKAVFVAQDQADDTQISSSYSAQTSQAAKTALVPGSIRYVPVVGDTLISDDETFMVQGVEVVKPGNLTLVYKLRVI